MLIAHKMIFFSFSAAMCSLVVFVVSGLLLLLHFCLPHSFATHFRYTQFFSRRFFFFPQWFPTKLFHRRTTGVWDRARLKHTRNQHLQMVSWKWFWYLLTNVRMWCHTQGEINLVYQIFTKIGDDKLITCNCDEKNCTVSIQCCSSSRSHVILN